MKSSATRDKRNWECTSIFHDPILVSDITYHGMEPKVVGNVGIIPY